jgi:hypothetical protein
MRWRGSSRPRRRLDAVDEEYRIGFSNVVDRFISQTCYSDYMK